MLRNALRPLKLLWVIFRAIRTGISGFVLMIAAATVIVPPTANESTLLDLTSDTTARNETLIIHRIAKAVKKINSDRLYRSLAETSDTGLTADDFRQLIDGFAEGSLQAERNVPEADDDTTRQFTSPLVEPVDNDNILAPRSNDAKFIAARTN